MKDGPDIAITAALIGDPARANMVMALMSGHSLTMGDLAAEAGVTLSTASVHLAKLEFSGIVVSQKVGRSRYFHLANPDVAHCIEALVTVAARAGHRRTRPGPREESMRSARSCYDHLAGRIAVGLFERWIAQGVLRWRGGAVYLTGKGRQYLAGRGIEVESLERSKRPLCRTCIDWSERRHHLGGAIGAAVLVHVVEQGWAERVPRSRTVRFSAPGERKFVVWYSSPLRRGPANRREMERRVRVRAA
jgi:DNA-binding transcriptional ArsR family regulator